MTNRQFFSNFQVIRASIIILISCAVSGSQAGEQWIDEALLADGRTIEVERSVSSNFGRGELINVLSKSPNQYSIAATNPDSGKRIRWAGEQNFNPILLDFWKGVPYLITFANSIYANMKQYGCPEIPYVFFRYDENSNHWNQISPKDFPTQLLHPNLSVRYDGYYMKNGARQSKENIANRNAKNDSYSLKSAPSIPTDFTSWSYRYKNQYRVGHSQDGCRHTVPSNEDPTHPQSPGQPSQEMALEVLETKTYEPDWILGPDDPAKIAASNAKNAKCRALLRRVGDESDRPELRGWLLFVNDPTGNKKARGTEPIFCDANQMWFVDSSQDRQRVILSKFTNQGDFIYRISFQKPDAPEGYQGDILWTKFHPEKGYLYFEWQNSYRSGVSEGAKVHVKRSMKVRVREPLVVIQ
jgi:hypothetical protein